MVIFKETTFDQLELPDKIYKYRRWSSDEHRRILTDSEIYFAAPSNFNEQHECFLERDFEAVNEEMFYQYFIYNGPPGLSEVEYREMAQERMMNSPIFNKEHQKESAEQFRAKLDESLSVFCASEHNNKVSLWETFADSQEGFCVGLNTRKMFDNKEIFGSGGNVTYYPKSNAPKIKAFCNTNDERVMDMMKVIFSLPDTFAEEKEYRLTKTSLENRRIKINKEAIEEVILGNNMGEDDKKEIIHIVQETLPGTKLLQANYNESFDSYNISEIE